MGHTVHSGAWVCTPRPGRPGTRLVTFRTYLNRLRDNVAPKRIENVWYEYVRHHTKGAVQAAHVYGALQGALQEWCEVNGVRCRGISETDIKKLSTGNARASKKRMIAAARRMGYTPNDDNEADAICLLEVSRNVMATSTKIYT